MAFCKQCGTNLNGANFCPSCGAAEGTITQQGDSRRQSMTLMQDLMDYFGAKKDKYEALDALIDRLKTLRAKRYTGWLVCGIICAVLAIGLLCIGSSDNYVLAAMVMLTPPAAMIALYVLLRKMNQKKIDAALLEADALNDELTEYYDAYGYCPIGQEYTHPGILVHINDVIRQGRANTPESAINVLLDDLHKAEMEQNAKRAADAATATAIAAAQTAENTRKAAKSARKAAGYASASFWFK